MKKWLPIIIVLLINDSLNAQTAGKNTLTFHAKNFNNNIGKAVIFLYRKTDKLPKSPFTTANSIIVNKEAVITLPNIPYGEYAAILLHDENNNGEIDHSFGLPSEQLGYTNGWEFDFFTGMPSFSKLRFQFKPSATFQNISITYKKNKK